DGIVGGEEDGFLEDRSGFLVASGPAERGAEIQGDDLALGVIQSSGSSRNPLVQRQRIGVASGLVISPRQVDLGLRRRWLSRRGLPERNVVMPGVRARPAQDGERDECDEGGERDGGGDERGGGGREALCRSLEDGRSGARRRSRADSRAPRRRRALSS